MSNRVAYIINQYPRFNHTFIRREILALERRGTEVLRIAVRGCDDELVDETDRREQALTHYLLRGGFSPLLFALLRTALTSPLRLLSALALTVRVGWRAERSLPYHLVYLAEACLIVPWLKSFSATHLHAHFGTNSAEIAMLAHALGGPPYSFTVHGQDELLSGGIREKVRNAAFVVAISSFGRSQLYRRVERAHWPKVRQVHCGLEPEFHELAPVPPPPAPRFVCVGRLSVEKGQALLVEAARLLDRRKVKFELVLAGDGEMRAELERSIADYGLAGAVRITGWISSTQVRSEILAARALVLPSFTEGLPVVVMEAMALRRPVLATYVGGVPELVRAGEHGWLFPAGSLESLTAAMADCLSRTPGELERMGNAAYACVTDRHSADVAATRLAALFQDPTVDFKS